MVRSAQMRLLSVMVTSLCACSPTTNQSKNAAPEEIGPTPGKYSEGDRHLGDLRREFDRAKAGRLRLALNGFDPPLVVSLCGRQVKNRCVTLQTMNKDLEILLAEDQYVLSFAGATQAAARKFSIAENEILDLEVNSPRPARVVGYARTAFDGKPLSGYRCRWGLFTDDRFANYFMVRPSLGSITNDRGRFELDAVEGDLVVTCYQHPLFRQHALAAFGLGSRYDDNIEPPLRSPSGQGRVSAVHGKTNEASVLVTRQIRQPFKTRMLGIRVKGLFDFRVDATEPKSVLAGELVAGDEIIEIGGRPLEGISYWSIPDILGEAIEKGETWIRVRNGESTRILRFPTSRLRDFKHNWRWKI